MLTLSIFAPTMKLPAPTTHCPHYRDPVSTIEPNTLNDSLPPHPPGVTNTLYEPHNQIALYLSSPPPLMRVLSCASTGIDSTTSGVPLLLIMRPLALWRYSLLLLPESDLRHQAPSRALAVVNPRRQGSLHADAVLNHISLINQLPPRPWRLASSLL